MTTKITSDVLKELRTEFAEAAEKVRGQPREVEDLRIGWLGRKGKVPALFAALKAVPREEKAAAGKAVNELKVFVEAMVADLIEDLRYVEIEHILSAEPLDVTLPGPYEGRPAGLHPVTLMRQRVEDIFFRLGFQVCDGPELELDFYNFAALNIPDDHPARDMQDTFYVTSDVSVSDGSRDDINDEVGGEGVVDESRGGQASSEVPLVLRTQTSNIQIHVLKDQRPPVRMIAPGRVFRFDHDSTHTPLFHQVEGLVVDEDISMGHLKGLVECFLRELLGTSLEVRFRPSYFPFVEPGAEVDLRPKGSPSWLEVGGCGMVHPNVFETVGCDSEVYSGYAFGFGLDRLAMLAWKLNDLRTFFLGDARFHRSFPLHVHVF